jgi:NADH-quinone oxidoreductase subunit F
MSKNIRALSNKFGREKSLFNTIAHIKVDDQSALIKAGEEFRIGGASVLGAASAYELTPEKIAAKKIHICNGSACKMAGTQTDLHKTLTTFFKDDDIGTIPCLGRCHEGGSFLYEGATYSNQDPDAIEKLMKGESVDGRDHYNIGSNLATPLLTADYDNPLERITSLATLLQKSPQALIEEVRLSKLRGRGGAGFATSFKLESCRTTEADIKYVVCNADEGDPGAYSDRYLLEQQPHRVLLGMVFSGFMTGAAKGYVYIRAEYPEAITIMKRTVEALRTAKWLGDSIQGSAFNFDVEIVSGAGSYICGEETALLASLEGRRPEVQVRPPFPTQSGLFGKPTLLSNVETFALLPAILSDGGETFAKIGTPASTGPKLVSLDSRFNKPGIYEIEMGTPLLTVINDFGGGFCEPVKAVQIGGPLGGLVPASHFDRLNLDFESFDEAGFLLGHASFVSIPETVPIITYMEHLFEFTMDESCGKCFPCRYGSVRGYEMLKRARTGEDKANLPLLEDLLETLEETSLCALGGGLPLPIRNALEHFPQELQAYFEEDSSHV